MEVVPCPSFSGLLFHDIITVLLDYSLNPPYSSCTSFFMTLAGLSSVHFININAAIGQQTPLGSFSSYVYYGMMFILFWT